MTAETVRRRDAPAEHGTPRRGGALLTAVGVLGEVLITLGVLLGLFVAWQLWWTDVTAGQVQDQVVQDLGWARTVESADGADAGTAAAEPVEALQHREPAPVLPEPAHATTFATLAVPRWGEDYVRPISQGVTRRDVLDVLGLGHYPGTAMPGQVGNFAVAGHRVTYGKPLNRVEELQLDDPLVVQTQDAWYVYRVSATQVVRPADVEVIAPVPDQPEAVPTTAMMTLTTCHPMYSARERFIVHAVLDYWMPVGDGPPPELTGGPAGGV